MSAKVPDPLAHVLGIAVPLLLCVVALVVIVRSRRYSSAHPERPYGRNLLLRLAPFITIGVVAVAWGLVAGDWLVAALGGIAVVCFTWEISRRWSPPREG